MNIISAEPAWCAGHPPHDDGVVHISREQVVVLTSGPQCTEAYVSMEAVGDDVPAVRIQGATDAPMSPMQAFELASTLQAFAVAALTPVAVQ